MKILQTILLTRSRDYLHSNSLCGKQNSVEQQLVILEFAAGNTTIEEKAAEHPRSPTLKIKSRLTARIAIMKQSTGRKQ